MKMCSALARRGHEVVLIAKRGPSISDQDDHSFYCVDHNFEIEKIARPAPRGGGVFYAASMAYEIVRRRRWADLVYCRDLIGALVAAELRLPLVFEAHGVPTSHAWRRACRRVASSRGSQGMVAITDALRQDLVSVGVSSQIVVAPDACDPPTLDVRTQVSRPARVGYVGNLYAGRGIETIVGLARLMLACRFVIVGGQPTDVERWKAQDLPSNIELLGFRPQSELPAHYASFDVVLMPHASSGVVGASGGDISRWTSPMKMFEYMASGVAIVASDLQVFREVLTHERNALLVPSSDLELWRVSIERLLGDAALRVRLATTAQQELRTSYTWDARARTVMTGLSLE